MSFPTDLDNLTNPVAGDYMDLVPHATQHALANNGIEALQVKVGIDGSADVTSLDYKVANSTKNTDTDLSSNSYFLDEDAMSSDDATKVASQQSIKAYIDAQIAAISVEAFKVGAIYTNVTGVNPSTELGYGTWSSFGVGKTPVGLDSGDTDFDVVESSTGSAGSGGAKTVTLSAAQMPAHTHSTNPPNTNSGTVSANHSHQTYVSFAVGGGSGAIVTGAPPDSRGNSTTGFSANHYHATNIGAVTSTSAGSGNAHNNLVPYITVYMWKRTS